MELVGKKYLKGRFSNLNLFKSAVKQYSGARLNHALEAIRFILNLTWYKVTTPSAVTIVTQDFSSGTGETST